VSITPASPTDDDVLTCVIDVESVDPDGSAVMYAYTWSVDGVDAGVSTASVGAAQTTVGEAWTCHVTASDGLLEAVGESDSVTIDAACSTGDVTLSSSGIDFVSICAQTFDMGCTAGQSGCNADESPVMPVTLSNDYYVSSTEITQGQYRSLMATNPSNFLACGDDCPVESVTWHMAAAFANAVSREAGLEECYDCIDSGSTTTCVVARDPYACGGYRLPTEAEWEGAARCGEDLLYAGSNVLDDVAWYASNSASKSWAVALKNANACGVYDMSGNVSEWTQDLYSDSFYTSSCRTDPAGARSGTYSVLRGGNLANSQNEQRVAFRSAYLPAFVNYNIGLRLARTAP
jgi:formylglycine-generating enzyme required for sulfatase activity